jgi:hypothetical protein
LDGVELLHGEAGGGGVRHQVEVEHGLAAPLLLSLTLQLPDHRGRMLNILSKASVNRDSPEPVFRIRDISEEIKIYLQFIVC